MIRQPMGTQAETSPHILGTTGRGIAFIVFLGLGLLGVGACTRDKPKVQAPPPEVVPVTTATALAKTVPIVVTAIGSVQAYSMVEVRPQVAGFIEEVLFREGQDVKKGDLLFRLDPRPFQATLAQLEANLARDEAQLQNARAQADRYTRLFEEGIVSKEQHDSFRTSADALAAAVRADRAAIERAKVDLSYCEIYAPLSGRTGNLLVDRGNVVRANETTLVVINQVHPIYVAFAVPEQQLDEIRKLQAKGPLKASAAVPDEDRPPAEGTLSFVDNTVDNTTGTIQLKATFANADSRLWPGQFVNVTLNLRAQPNTVVVPSQAVQTGQDGQYVFVVNSNLTADSRPVVPGATVGDETVIEQGIQAGDQVITSGQLRLTPGAKVDIKNTPERAQGNPS